MNFVLRLLGAMPAGIVLVTPMLVLSSAPALPAVWGNGALINTWGYCLKETDARTVSGQIAEGGMEAYKAYILEDGNSCYHSGLVLTPILSGTVQEMTWTVIGPDGEVIEFYHLQTQKGDDFWSWTVQPRQGA